MRALSTSLQGRLPYSQEESFPRVRRNGKLFHAYSPDGGHSAASVSKMLTTMLRHFDQEERQIDGSRHWDSTDPVLMRAFAHEGARDFSDKNCLRPDS